MTPKSGNRPEHIGEIIRERIRSLGWGSRLREEEVYTCWGEIAGAGIATHARPSHIDNRRLTIVTESPVWTQQLVFLKSDLLRRIRERIGPEIVTDLYFITGRIDPPFPPASPQPPSAEALPVSVPADIEREITAIPDGEVREAVRRLCQAARRRLAGC